MSEDSGKITLALVDDEALFVSLLKGFFEQKPDIRVSLTANDGGELLEKLAEAETLPDILMIDLRMTGMDGLSTIEVMREKYKDIRIAVVSSHYKKTFMGYMLKSGVSAFAPKGVSPDVLYDMIKGIADNGYFFLPEQMDVIRKQVSSKAPGPKLEPESMLSEREVEVLELICKQCTAQEIADKLFITKRTVEGHRSNLLLKTGAKNVAGLVLYAVQHRLIDLDECVRF
ncbi:DNA-binding response regulator (plasmid) [Fulvitalea axinellae]|uniref:DNA-binding response regulator n=1 Tax=Fulvitalea axinellae TaxID=1182444 RepID=A0AAU9CL73_9BACT|nr:DNA-binding response regulator [Fulvitalea axinellae]